MITANVCPGTSTRILGAVSGGPVALDFVFQSDKPFGVGALGKMGVRDTKTKASLGYLSECQGSLVIGSSSQALLLAISKGTLLSSYTLYDTLGTRFVSISAMPSINTFELGLVPKEIGGVEFKLIPSSQSGGGSLPSRIVASISKKKTYWIIGASLVILILLLLYWRKRRYRLKL